MTDAAGNPVRNAAVTVAAVDEGICQLTGFKTPDPFGVFHPTAQRCGVGTADLYGQLMPEVPKADKVSPVGGDKDAYDPRHLSPVSAKRVKPVAIVSGVLHTDERGPRARRLQRAALYRQAAADGRGRSRSAIRVRPEPRRSSDRLCWSRAVGRDLQRREINSWSRSRSSTTLRVKLTPVFSFMSPMGRCDSARARTHRFQRSNWRPTVRPRNLSR